MPLADFLKEEIKEEPEKEAEGSPSYYQSDIFCDLSLTKKSNLKFGVIKVFEDPNRGVAGKEMGHQIVQKTIEGLTLEMCRSGELEAKVLEDFIETIKSFDKDEEIDGITGDCAFMTFFLGLAKQHTQKPVFMTALAQLPAITSAFNKDERISIITASLEDLNSQLDLLE